MANWPSHSLGALPARFRSKTSLHGCVAVELLAHGFIVIALVGRPAKSRVNVRNHPDMLVQESSTETVTVLLVGFSACTR